MPASPSDGWEARLTALTVACSTNWAEVIAATQDLSHEEKQAVWMLLPRDARRRTWNHRTRDRVQKLTIRQTAPKNAEP